MNTTSPTACPAWKKLEAHAETWRDARLADLFASDPRAREALVAEAPGLRLDYSRQRVGALTLRLLAQLAAERGFDEWRAALFAGERDQHDRRPRRHAHRAARGRRRAGDVKSNLQKITSLARSIRDKKQFKRIVNLGTGGSDLGPRLLADAFGDGALDVRFVANVDPVELERALAGADPATHADRGRLEDVHDAGNHGERASALRRWGFKNVQRRDRERARPRSNSAPSEILPMPDSVGGRYSVWSAAGFAGLLAIGGDAFGEFLAGGARDRRAFPQRAAGLERAGADGAARRLERQLPRPARARGAALRAPRCACCPPTCSSWRWNPTARAWTARAAPVDYATCPVLFGAEGTPAQHAFMQLLHQGTQAVAGGFHRRVGATPALSANRTRRPMRWRMGQRGRRRALPPHRRHPGNRPSSILDFRAFTRAGPRPPDRAVRAQGVHPGRALEHQQLRPVGRRARQATGATASQDGEA